MVSFWNDYVRPVKDAREDGGKIANSHMTQRCLLSRSSRTGLQNQLKQLCTPWFKPDWKLKKNSNSNSKRPRWPQGTPNSFHIFGPTPHFEHVGFCCDFNGLFSHSPSPQFIYIFCLILFNFTLLWTRTLSAKRLCCCCKSYFPCFLSKGSCIYVYLLPTVCVRLQS